jgi:hypothetical protein
MNYLSVGGFGSGAFLLFLFKIGVHFAADGLDGGEGCGGLLEAFDIVSLEAFRLGEVFGGVERDAAKLALLATTLDDEDVAFFDGDTHSGPAISARRWPGLRGDDLHALRAMTGDDGRKCKPVRTGSNETLSPDEDLTFAGVVGGDGLDELEAGLHPERVGFEIGGAARLNGLLACGDCLSADAFDQC